MGCEKPIEDDGHDGESDNESERTMVSLTAGGSLGLGPHSEELDHSEGYREDFENGESSVIYGSSSPRLSQTESERQSLSAGTPSTRGQSDMPDSLDAEPGATGEQIVVPSSSRRPGTRPSDPDRSYWITGFPVVQHPRYYFVVTPLRLSPQCEHWDTVLVT